MSLILQGEFQKGRRPVVEQREGAIHHEFRLLALRGVEQREFGRLDLRGLDAVRRLREVMPRAEEFALLAVLQRDSLAVLEYRHRDGFNGLDHREHGIGRSVGGHLGQPEAEPPGVLEVRSPQHPRRVRQGHGPVRAEPGEVREHPLPVEVLLVGVVVEQDLQRVEFAVLDGLAEDVFVQIGIAHDERYDARSPGQSPVSRLRLIGQEPDEEIVVLVTLALFFDVADDFPHVRLRSSQECRRGG